MTAPHELRLERLGDRNGRQSGHVGEVARVAAPVTDASFQRESETTSAALNNLVFTAPGAAEWLRGLRRTVMAWLSARDPAPKVPVPPNAIHAADANSSAGSR
jgi:hypothetical protein